MVESMCSDKTNYLVGAFTILMLSGSMRVWLAFPWVNGGTNKRVAAIARCVTRDDRLHSYVASDFPLCLGEIFLILKRTMVFLILLWWSLFGWLFKSLFWDLAFARTLDFTFEKLKISYTYNIFNFMSRWPRIWTEMIR